MMMMMIMMMNLSSVESILRLVIPGLHRGLVGPVAELKQHSQEVLDLIKERVEEETFSQVYTEIQMSLAKQKVRDYWFCTYVLTWFCTPTCTVLYVGITRSVHSYCTALYSDSGF